MYRVRHFAVYGKNEMQSFLSNATVYLKKDFFYISSLPLFDNRKHTRFSSVVSPKDQGSSLQIIKWAAEKKKKKLVRHWDVVRGEKTAEIWVCLQQEQHCREAEEGCRALAHSTQWEVQKLSVKEALKQAFMRRESSLSSNTQELWEWRPWQT